MKKRLCIVTIILSALLIFAGCSSSAPMVNPLVPSDYPDPPASERLIAQPIYMAWDGINGESWSYEFSKDGIIEECSEPTYDPEDENAIEMEELPGGRYVWFQGVSPGDVVVTFTTKNAKGKVVSIQQTAFRVFDDLTIALLHSENENFR